MTTLDLNNNESIKKGIIKLSEKEYLVLTFSTSKTFKTLKGAEKFLSKFED